MAESKRIVKLKTSDEIHIFEVDEAVAFESKFLKNRIEDFGVDEPIHLLNVSSKILQLVIEYCTYHVEKRKIISAADKSTIQAEEALVVTWDAEFMKNLVDDQQTLFALVLVAKHLGIQNLLDLARITVKKYKISGKTIEEIRKAFNIRNDFTPEEEEELRRENVWAVED